MPGYSRATYSEGHLFYVRDGTLLAAAVRRSPRNRERIADGVVRTRQPMPTSEGDAAFDVVASGVLIYYLEPGRGIDTAHAVRSPRPGDAGPDRDAGA